ncbi:MAG: MMPL family transporter, partial [Acidimicrobiales bacterium]|nr:MMPL family transporter [Acidimicrobiales bacterium]
MLSRLATFCYRRRRWIVLAWLVLLVGISLLSNAAGKAFSQDFKLANSDSQKAFDVLAERFPGRSGLTGDIVFKADAGITDPGVQARLEALFTEIKRVEGVVDVRTPYSGPMAAAQIAPSGNIGYAIIQFGGESSNEISRSTIAAIESLVANARADDLQVELGGFLFQEREPPGSEAIGLLAAVVILLVAFGSVLAMGLPITTALFGIGVGFGVVNLLAHLTSVPEFSTQLAAMIGIGVGIDYALFIVTRYRQALADGLEPETAVVTAIDTAGRAVLFAGCTVVISLAGMLLIGIKFVQGLGLAAASVVAVTMVASVTLLPAVLGFVGRNIDRFAIPGLGKHAHGSRQGFWFRWSRLLQHHSWVAAVGGLVLLLGLATPVFSMRLGSSDESNLPETMTVRRAYDLKAEGFGAGASGPLLLVAELPDGVTPQALLPVLQAVQADPGVAQVAPPMPSPSGDAAIIQVIPTTSSQDEATIELIERLRSEILPAATEGTGITVHVGGVTALFEDLAVQLQRRLPVFIGVVLALSFLLLLVVFRSVLVPVKAVLMNLLSIGAAYGVVVAVFQWGWGCL